MTDQTPPTDTRMVPFDQLYLHPFNPRQDGSDEDTEAMAESIAINGLLQNLCAYHDPEREGFGIVAGGRRLRGLEKLRAEGWRRHHDVMHRYDTVPVRVTEDPMLARSWAATENVTHRALHPADEVRAYRAMTDQGSSPEMIARAFGQSALHVQRRLRLSQLPEPALEALKADRISIDVARALTISDDEARVLAALDGAVEGRRPAEWVKRELATGMIRSSDRRAKFVGFDAYVSEGGRVTRDLFEGHDYLHDEALLDRLFAAKLEAEAERVRTEEGWQWVKHSLEQYIDWSLIDGRPRLHPTPCELPEADELELERLNEQASSQALGDDEAARLEELERRAEGEFSDEDRATGGILVYVAGDGTLAVSRAYGPKPEPRAGDDASDETGASAGTEGKPAITQTCMDDLHAMRLHALQSALVDKPNLLLDLLAFSLEAGGAWANPIGVNLETPPIEPQKPGSFQPDSRLTELETGRRFDATVDWPAFDAFRAKGQKHRNAVLALHLARAVRMSEMWQALWKEAGANLRARWTPDAENLFKRMRGDQLPPLWRALTGLSAEDAAEFEKLKKGDQAAELEALFGDMSKREALGLGRETNAKIDAWTPAELGIPGSETDVD